MQGLVRDSHPHDRVADFYVGKSVFVTGASGYVGAVLLESLLRCCPGITKIFILLRPKKGVDPIKRKDEMLQKKLFDLCKEESPDALDKVHVVEGNISSPNLGMSYEDYETITQEVSIIFHSAAVVSFIKPLDYMLKQNAVSVDYVIQLARKLKKLDILVYVSTAYVNANRKRDMKECVYRMPFHSQKFLDALDSNNVEMLSELVKDCIPSWPNTYVFSKCLAENILVDKASDLPLAIVRPSIISSTWKTPIPGYFQGSTAASEISLAIGKGYIKVFLCNPESKMNWIPVDVVTNTLIVSAWSVATGRSESPFVANCVLYGDCSRWRMKDFVDILEIFNKEHVLPKTFQTPSKTIVTKNRLWYKITTFVHHYIPAFVLDTVLYILGKKPKMTALYKFFDKMMDITAHFSLNLWEFRSDNFIELNKLLHPEDKELFTIDLTDYNFVEVLYKVPYAAPFYDPKIDSRSPEQRKRIMQQRYWGITAIKYAGVFLIFFSFYLLAVIIHRIYETFALEIDST